MPQNNVLPDWRVTYPNDAPVQKPGGVTVLTTATAPRVPNKPTYAAGTIQSFETFMAAVAEWDAKQAEAREEAAAEEPVEEEEHEEVEEDDGNGGTVKRRRPRRR
jgi:hypothetical protein